MVHILNTKVKTLLSILVVSFGLFCSQVSFGANNNRANMNDISVPVLMFHSINNSSLKSDKYLYKNSFSVSNLESLLSQLKDKGFHTLTLEKLHKGDYDKKSVVLTFDDGYSDYYIYAAPLLEKYGFRGVVGVITSRIGVEGYLTAERIRDLQGRGHDMISHSVTHSEMNKLSLDKQLKELTESRTTLQKITGVKSNSFIFPVGRWNSDSLVALEREGYKLAFTTAKGRYKKGVNKLVIPRMRIDNGLKVGNIIRNLELSSR